MSPPSSFQTGVEGGVGADPTSVWQLPIFLLSAFPKVLRAFLERQKHFVWGHSCSDAGKLITKTCVICASHIIVSSAIWMHEILMLADINAVLCVDCSNQVLFSHPLKQGSQERTFQVSQQ